jgi:hypothetical protein
MRKVNLRCLNLAGLQRSQMRAWMHEDLRGNFPAQSSVAHLPRRDELEITAANTRRNLFCRRQPMVSPYNDRACRRGAEHCDDVRFEMGGEIRTHTGAIRVAASDP